MQARHKVKEPLELIVYDANGEAVAACRDSATADTIKPDHGYVYHHDDPWAPHSFSRTNEDEGENENED